MNRIAGHIACLALFCSPLLIVPARAEGLDPSFSHALAEAYLGNPQLATERQHLREVDEGVPRALSGWRPTLQITGDAGASAQFDSIDTAHQPERRLPQQGVLSLTQPLYTGGRVGAEVARSQALVAAERAALQATEAAVLLAAATAYVDVARDQAIVTLDADEDRVLLHSLSATRAAHAAGALTEADIAQARARLADASGVTAQAQGALDASRATFEQQVGEMPGALLVPVLRWPGIAMTLPDDPDRALRLSARANFDLKEATLALLASQQGVDVARAGLLPHISLVIEAERVKETDVQMQHQRDDIAEGLLQLSVPLYQGGLVSAETRQAKEAARTSALQVETVRRAVRQQTLTALDRLEAARRRMAEQGESIDANRIAERGIARQQSVGARTVLDVLNAQQELVTARVNLIEARHDEVLAAFQLLAVTGGLSAAALGLPVPIYDPTLHYKATRGRWYGLEPSP